MKPSHRAHANRDLPDFGKQAGIEASQFGRALNGHLLPGCDGVILPMVKGMRS